jgi:phage gpG-like protein
MSDQGQGVSMQWNLVNDQITEQLHKLAALDLTPLKQDIGEYMIGQIQDRFDGQRLVDGTKMPQSAAAKARSGQTLMDKRLLYKSYVYQATPEGVEVGSDSPYARIHHFGGETGRTGHRFDMLPRPVMGENAKDLDVIGNKILNTLRGMA